jgi:hypothetical protein
VIPLSAQRVALQTSIATYAYENLRYAQALLGHQLATRDLAEVIERASELIVREAEKQKFCATSRPRRSRHGSSADPRHIPPAVKCAVWERDGGQCGFVSEAGQRCPARTRLETIWNDGLAVVRSCHLREERPTSVARGHPRSRVSASGARAAYERSPSWARRVSPS